MTILGDTLELLHLASGQLTTVEAVGHEWHNTELSRQAMERIRNSSIAMLTSRGKNARIIPLNIDAATAIPGGQNLDGWAVCMSACF